MMKYLSFLLLTALCLSSCSGTPAAPLEIAAQIDIPVDPSKPEAARFIPAETPLKVEFHFKETGKITEKYQVMMRVIDHKDRVYCEHSWPLPEIEAESLDLVRLFRIENMPGSKKIRIQAALAGSDGQLFITAGKSTEVWHDIISGYAIHRSKVLSKGWYSREDSDCHGTEIKQWCKGAGVIHFARPLFPMLCKIEGYSEPECFPGKEWPLQVSLNGEIITSNVYSQKMFSQMFLIPDFHDLDIADSKDYSWPEGEIELILESDKTFNPMECSGNKDTRSLAFYLDTFEYSNFIKESGFYGPKEADGNYWPSPEFSVALPIDSNHHDLYFQGIRATDCIKTPQEITFIVNNQSYIRQIEDASFCLVIPLQIQENQKIVHVTVRTSPIFFKGQCQNIDDSNPYGVGFSEICIR